MVKRQKMIALIVLDGWGISNNTQGNAIKKANLPTIDKLNRFYPMVALQASGISVGLPWGENGNSEVGHMSMGAGKIIYQNLPRITLSIQDGTFFSNPSLLEVMKKAKEKNTALHLMGLIGEGSVHSHKEHFFSLLEMAKKNNLQKVFLHLFTDGRDSPPNSATKVLKETQEKMRFLKIGKIATLCGRYWAMDRNKNWDRTQKAYLMLTQSKGNLIQDPFSYLQDCYYKEIFDEYIEPAVITENNQPIATIKDEDSVIFFNYREDRARQLTKAFVLPDFDGFERPQQLRLNFVTMIEYEKNLPTLVAFPPEKVEKGLGEILSSHKIKQFRIAETEKYAHVTYFFNGGKEESWPGEDRILVPSPVVSRFDEAPEMSAPLITEKVVEAIRSQKYGFILANFANPDMVGHTGNETACIEAVQSVDKSLSIIIPEVIKADGYLFITSDHGNVEEVRNPHTGQTDTEHSSNPVPLWFITSNNHREKTAAEMVRQQNEVHGLLADIAPTILDILGIPKPETMNGESLLPILK